MHLDAATSSYWAALISEIILIEPLPETRMTSGPSARYWPKVGSSPRREKYSSLRKLTFRVCIEARYSASTHDPLSNRNTFSPTLRNWSDSTSSATVDIL